MGDMKPFPCSSVCLAEIKHSFAAQNNPPFHASAPPDHLPGEAAALLRFQALHPSLSRAAPAHTSKNTFPERMSPTLPVHKPLWVVPPSCFLGDHRGLSEKAGTAVGLARGLAIKDYLWEEVAANFSTSHPPRGV